MHDTYNCFILSKQQEVFDSYTSSIVFDRDIIKEIVSRLFDRYNFDYCIFGSEEIVFIYKPVLCEEDISIDIDLCFIGEEGMIKKKEKDVCTATKLAGKASALLTHLYYVLHKNVNLFGMYYDCEYLELLDNPFKQLVEKCELRGTDRVMIKQMSYVENKDSCNNERKYSLRKSAFIIESKNIKSLFNL